ncbi:MAG: zinc-ribbon domain-containing protein, partial [Clostridia bacterium]|nr:zinc-ribbon domain-containing protein [Clostridia bacterium]
MANCAYCGTKLDDSAKFCTACGAQVEQAPVQPEAAQQSETVQGSYTAPTQGSYTAPAQGSYTAPAQGSYTAPQQGTYTPAQSYTPPVQTPTSAAADSGSYVPPVQNSAPGGNYAPKAKAKMPKMPKAPAGKKRLFMLGGIALAVILLIALVSSCGGGGGADADDPNLGVYNAVTAEMWGMEMPITDMFENGVSIELKEKGKCVMNIDGTTGKGKWTLEDGVFYAEAGGAELNGTLEKGVLYAENVLDMGVNLTFEKEGGYVEPAAIEDPGVAIESSGIEKQWDGTWYGVMYVYEAEGDFAGIPSD